MKPPKLGGLMISLGGGKKPSEKSDQPPFGGKEEEPEEKDEESGEMDSFLEDAFDALQDGDKEGFLTALKGAIACY